MEVIDGNTRQADPTEIAENETPEQDQGLDTAQNFSESNDFCVIDLLGGDDSDDGQQYVYDEAWEQMPHHVAYDEEFPRIQQSLAHIPREVLQILDSSNCANARVEHCRKKARELIEGPRAEREKIGLLGNAGEGKSSVINSLLGLPRLAKAVSGGESCTNVGTEYHSPFDGQSKRFAVKVQYFDLSDIENSLREWLGDFTLMCCDKPDQMSHEEETKYWRLYTTASDTFKYLFCNRKEFQSDAAAIEYLSRCHREKKGEALRQMKSWCWQLLNHKTTNAGGRCDTFEADTEKELHQQLDPLVSSIKNADFPQLWPLVNKVQVGVQGPKILEHIILIDLPGLNDTNKVRVNAAESMLKQCEWIWVVTRIGRAISDENVDAALRSYGRAHPMAVVCTCIDEHIDDALIQYLRAQGQNINGHDELHEQEKRLSTQVNKGENLIRSNGIKYEGQDSGSAGRPIASVGGDWKLRVQEKLDELKPELSRVSQERFELLVSARNSNIVGRIKADKTKHCKCQKQLPVFCVSNTHYAALKGVATIQGPRLSAAGTGVPAMRRFIFEPAGPTVQNTLIRYIDHNYTTFLAGLALWAHVSSVERTQNLLGRMSGIYDDAHRAAEDCTDGLRASADVLFRKELERKHPDVVDCAQQKLDEKSRWKWNTIRAFVRKDGRHSTSVMPLHSWNEQFVERLDHVFQPAWTQLESNRLSLEQQLEDSLKEMVENIKSSLENEPTAFVVPMRELNAFFKGQQAGIRNACRKHARGTQKGLLNMRRSLMQDRPSGYFTRAMAPAYERAKAVSGPGYKGNVLEIFKNHLGQRVGHSTFSQAVNSFMTAIADDGRDKNTTLCRAMDEIWNDIQRQIKCMADEKIKDPVEVALREQLKQHLVEAEEQFKRIKKDLADLKRRYEIVKQEPED